MNNMSERKLRTFFVISLLLNLWGLLMWNKSIMDYNKCETQINQFSKEIDSLRHVNDSLYWELFPVQLELGKYEFAHEIFMGRNPKAASQFSDIISKETE